MDDGFRGPQVCTIVGITYRQLDYWARTNLLRPSLADAKGSGSQRRYSYQDLVELKVIKQLLDAKIELKAARTAVEYLRQHLGEDIGSARLVLSGDNPLLVRDDGQLIDLLRNGQGVLNVVPLEGLVQQLDAAIVAFRPRTLIDADVVTVDVVTTDVVTAGVVGAVASSRAVGE